MSKLRTKPPGGKNAAPQFRRRLSTMLLGSMVIVSILIAVMGLVAYVQVRYIQAIVTETLSRSETRYLGTRIRVEGVLLSDLTREYVSQTQPEDKVRVRIFFDESSSRIDRLFEQVSERLPQEQTAVKNALAGVEAFRIQANTAMQIYDQEGQYGPLTQAALAELAIRRNPMLDAIEELERIQTGQLDLARKQAQNMAQSALWLILGAGGAILLLAVVTGVINSRSVLMPLSRLQRGVELVAKGTLDQPIEIYRQDEFGQLAQGFNTMMNELRQLQEGMESQVAARTAQLLTSADVARAASSILNPQELLQQTIDLICNRFGYYYAAIFLLDETVGPGEQPAARLRAGWGEPGTVMLARGHKFELGQGMVGWVCQNKQARIALDVGQDAVRFANPLLPNSRSEIALPLRAGERVLGALDVQSEQPAAFDESDIAVLQGVADQIAIALENARLFDQAQFSLAQNEQLITQIQTSLMETSALYATSQAIASAQDPTAVFRALIDNMLGAQVTLCLLVLFDPYETDTPQQLEIAQTWSASGQPGLAAGAHFDFANFPLRSLLRADQTTIIHNPTEAPASAASQRLWQRLEVHTLAFVPLNVGARWIGALALGAPSEQAFDQAKLRTYEATAGQAAAAIENHRSFASAQASLRELSAIYRTYTREVWDKAIQARPELVEYTYGQSGPAGVESNTFHASLTVREQQIGSIELERPERFSEQERLLVQAVCAQAAAALDSARLFDQTQRLAGRERLINEITAQLRASTSVSAILQTAARELAKATNVPHVVARIRPEEHSEEASHDK